MSDKIDVNSDKITLKGDKNIAFLTFKSNLQWQIHPSEVDTS